MISVSVALNQTPVYTARLVRRAVCLLTYVPAFASTDCVYPRRDGQAELTWVVGYIPRWFTRLATVTLPYHAIWKTQ